jgi:hypothetical protein
VGSLLFPPKFYEDQERLRNLDNYSQQLAWLEDPAITEQERERRSKETGINSGTILTEVPDFDPTQQMEQDVFHDLLEGFVGHHLRLFLHHLVVTTRVVSLDTLNSRISLPNFPLPICVCVC